MGYTLPEVGWAIVFGVYPMPPACNTVGGIAEEEARVRRGWGSKSRKLKGCTAGSGSSEGSAGSDGTDGNRAVSNGMRGTMADGMGGAASDGTEGTMGAQAQADGTPYIGVSCSMGVPGLAAGMLVAMWEESSASCCM